MGNSLSSAAISVFCKDLAMMYAAGIQTDEALDLLGDDSGAEEFASTAHAAAEHLRNDPSLASALRATGAFPDYAISALVAGESSGRIEETLSLLSSYYDDLAETETQFKRAIVYPTVLLFLMSAILLVLVIAVLPVFNGVYASLTGDVSSSGYAYVSAANVICVIALVITLVAAIALLAVCIMCAGKSGRSGAFLKVFDKIPGMANTVLRMSKAEFTSVMAIYVASGINPDDAVSRVKEVFEDHKLMGTLDKISASMAAGEGFGKAAADAGMYEPLYARMLVSGSRSGRLENSLGDLSRMLYSDARDRLEGAIGNVEPALAGFLTVVVGLSLVSVMLPLIGILGSIG